MEKFLPIFLTLLFFTSFPFLFSMLAFFKKKVVFRVFSLIAEVIGISGSLFIPLLITLLITMLTLGKVQVDMGGLIAVILIGFGVSIVLSIVNMILKNDVIYYVKWGVYALIVLLGTVLFITAPGTVTSSTSGATTATALNVLSLLF